MGGEDLTKHFYNNLRIVDMSRCALTVGTWTVVLHQRKQIKKKPFINNFINSSPELTHWNLKSSFNNMTGCNSNPVLDFIATELAEGAVSNLEFLGLRQNKIPKASIPSLGTIMTKLSNLKVLDLSKCSLGVAGGHLLKEPQSNCKKLEYLCLFNNLLDVDGMRSISKALEVQSSLKFIDFGFNRIKDEGQRNLKLGLNKNKNSKLTALGLRYNFLSDDGVKSFITEVTSSSLETLFLKNNNLTNDLLAEHKETALKKNAKLYCDFFDKIEVNDESKLNRTIFVSPANMDGNQPVKNFFDARKTGVILNIRIRKGQNYPNRADNQHFAFIEFASELSVHKSLMIPKRKRLIGSKKIDIYRAGTATYFYSKNCKVKNSKTNYAKNVSKGDVRKKIVKRR